MIRQASLKDVNEQSDNKLPLDGGSFEERVLKALKETNYNARNKPRDDFFLKYLDGAIIGPMILLYILIFLIILLKDYKLIK